MMAMRNVSMMGLALSADPNSHVGSHHQLPVSPTAQLKSGGQKLGTLPIPPGFLTRPGRVKPTCAPAYAVMKITVAATAIEAFSEKAPRVAPPPTSPTTTPMNR